ncbi:hypothetical protein TNCV_4833811 [Trichonephila clavipes]|nr:hypothetical protein TNCV_4833811 [Trichonephila clavipes]
MDRKDVIYRVTWLRTTSTDESSRRPSHPTTRTRRANCHIGRCQDTGSTFPTDPCVFPNHRKVPFRRISGVAASFMCTANAATHRRLRLD